MSTSTLASPAVAEFAAAVRAALSDLAPDEIDDLTDGLEADLTDRLSDTDAADLGDPRAYAEELRAAAGLPHRPAARGSFAAELAELRHAPRIVATAFREFGAAHPWLGRVRDFFVALRPLWWVFRAGVVTALVWIGLGRGWWEPVNGFTVVVGVAALVVSVQFGRGKWLPFTWMRGLLLAVNVILALCAPFIVVGAATSMNNGWYSTTYADDSNPDFSNTGLLENGNQVMNIFAYDAQGNPIDDVQLFDQDGKPLNLNGDPVAAYSDGQTYGFLTVPNAEVPGRLGWNVFPLDQVKGSAVSQDGTSIKSSAHRIPAELPFATAKPLAGAEGATAAPTPTPVPTPVPTPTPTP
jgi:hypothetical protein